MFPIDRVTSAFLTNPFTKIQFTTDSQFIFGQIEPEKVLYRINLENRSDPTLPTLERIEEGHFNYIVSPNGQHIAFNAIEPIAVTDLNGELDVYYRPINESSYTRISVAVDGFSPRLDSSVNGVSNDGRVLFSTNADLVLNDPPGTNAYIRSVDLNSLSIIDGESFPGNIPVSETSATSNNFEAIAFSYPAGVEYALLDDDRIIREDSIDTSPFDDGKISGDGRFLFTKEARIDLITGDVVDINQTIIGEGEFAFLIQDYDISDNGRYLLFTSDRNDIGFFDTNNVRDAFIYDFDLGTLERVSVQQDGSQFTEGVTEEIAISPDGSLAAFTLDNLAQYRPLTGSSADFGYFFIVDGEDIWIAPGFGEGLSAGEAREVAYLYEAGLDRDGNIDLPGLNFWIDQREAGLTEQQLARAFLDSGEFEQAFGAPETLSDVELVEQLYLNVLDRPGEQAGVDFWVSVVGRADVSREDLLIAFAESPENLAGSAFVETLTETTPGEWEFG